VTFTLDNVVPAHAGLFRSINYHLYAKVGRPRARGAVPGTSSINAAPIRSSPRPDARIR
jgi:hypothetical protein